MSIGTMVFLSVPVMRLLAVSLPNPSNPVLFVFIRLTHVILPEILPYGSRGSCVRTLARHMCRWYTVRVMNINDYISIDRDICHGKPCFKGTRIMVYLVLDMLEYGATFKDIKDAYPSLTKEHVQASLEFAARAVETGRYDAALMTSDYAIPAR